MVLGNNFTDYSGTESQAFNSISHISDWGLLPDCYFFKIQLLF